MNIYTIDGPILLVLVLVLVLVLGLFAGCRSYGHKHFEPHPDPTPSYQELSIQVDDYGSFWDVDEAQRALDEVSKASSDGNVVVLLYVHGWHHNAGDSDSNLAGFRMTLCNLAKKLGGPMYVESRRKLTGSPDVKVIGIYVGWRGRSMPSTLDYGTIWGRKAAAERVGSGDFREFLMRLQKIYEQRNAAPRTLFMGLVATGHSLGAQVLFKATADTLERDMVSVTDSLSGLSGVRPKSAPAPVEGIGDIIVLLNPALEAYQFERISQLNSRLQCSYTQTPVLLVVSGEGDAARQCWFPMSRRLARPFRPAFRDDQALLWRRALGEYKPQRTHVLTKSGAQDTLTEASYDDTELVLKTDFTAPISLGGATLMPDAPNEFRPYSPVVVAYTSSKIIVGHNGIFTKEFRDFLTNYVAFVEGKRMLLRYIARMSDVVGPTTTGLAASAASAGEGGR